MLCRKLYFGHVVRCLITDNLRSKLLFLLLDLLFPVLDVVRLAIRTEQTNSHFFGGGFSLFQHLLQLLGLNQSLANDVIALRILCNAFMYEAGRVVMLGGRDDVMAVALSRMDKGNKQMQVVVTSLLLNYAVCDFEHDQLEGKTRVISAAAQLTQMQLDAEASFRLLVALGTVTEGDENSISLAKGLGLSEFVTQCKLKKEPAKLNEAANFLAKTLRIMVVGT